MAKKKNAKKTAKANTKRTKVTKAKTSSAKAAKGPKKFVYFFGNGKADGDRSMKDTLGGKGAGLAEIDRKSVV